MNRYFYIDGEGRQKGTFSPDELKNEGINRNTLVWSQGMSDWKPAGEVADLGFLFADSTGYYPSAQTQSMPTPPLVQPVAAAGQSAPAEPMPKTWLTESILVTILPFLLCGSTFSLLGIIAIVNASKVESLFLRGEYDASDAASKQARKWTKITFWISIGWILVLILFVVAMFVFGVSMAGLNEVFSNVYEI